ncbi:MAG: hypothetical protein HFG54_15390 [Lachnospiraceae bacterium]|nr:hypothetical protein [Lachnospiraceae bacterium]
MIKEDQQRIGLTESAEVRFVKKAEKIWLYWNTVKSLKWIQIKHQIKKRTAKGAERKLLKSVKQLSAPETVDAGKLKLLIPELDCEDAYLQRFHVNNLLNNQVELLHEVYVIADTWKIPEASHLWNYNLHYLEFLIPLAVEYRRTSEKPYFFKWKELMESWLRQVSRDSLEPYTISLRIPNMLICMELLQEELHATALEKRLLTSLYQQYRYLIYTQELSLLANHYFENLKAIVIASLFFQEREVYEKYFKLFLRQIHEQILSDGFHFELSFMYHRIILEDILRVHKALNSLEYTGDGEKLVSAIKKMASRMMELEKGFDGRIPLFNDAGNNVAKGKRELYKAAAGICRLEDEAALKRRIRKSGYYKLSTKDIELLFDCGEIGPSYMGGHGHCDCLSFELSVQGKMMFVNSGTGQYQGGLRAFFRSTAAHNTLMIDDREQSELWGEHRAARRLTKICGTERENEIEGSFRSYLGDTFRRILKWKDKNRLVIIDDFTAHDQGIHMAKELLHLAPGYEYGRDGGKISIKEKQRLAALIFLPDKSDCLIHKDGVITTYAEEFGKYEKKQVLEIRTPFKNKGQVHIEIEIMTGDFE